MAKIQLPKKFDSEYFAELDARLRERFGTPAAKSCPDPTGALVRGILSQNTNDTNRDRAYGNLVREFPTWNEVLAAPEEKIAALVRPAGMMSQRAARIKKLLRWLAEHNGGVPDASFLLEMPHTEAVKLLTSVDGIGLKTAAVFLLFCGGAPLFPVDTHIRRIMTRLGAFPPRTPPDRMIMPLSEIIPPELHMSLHLNLLNLGRQICTARKPHCEICPVADMCEKKL